MSIRIASSHGFQTFFDGNSDHMCQGEVYALEYEISESCHMPHMICVNRMGSCIYFKSSLASLSTQRKISGIDQPSMDFSMPEIASI